MDSVIWRIQLLFCAIQSYEEVEGEDKRTKEDIVDELNLRLIVLKRLAEIEREGLSESVQGSERGLTLFLPVFDDAMDIIALDTNDDRIRNWRHRFEHIWWLQALFITKNRYLGLGPKSLMSRDQVWILAGADTPLVLRPLSNGRHQLVGEAYVHGIMHGEAL